MMRAKRVVIIQGRDPPSTGALARLVIGGNTSDQPAGLGVVRVRPAVREVVERDPGITERFHHPPGPIWRRIADDDHFEILVGLREDRGDRALAKQPVVVVRWDHHRDERIRVGVGELIFRVGPQLPQADAPPMGPVVHESQDLDEVSVLRSRG